MLVWTGEEAPNARVSETTYPEAPEPSPYWIDHGEERLADDEEVFGSYEEWFDNKQEEHESSKTNKSDEPVSGSTDID